MMAAAWGEPAPVEAGPGPFGDAGARANAAGRVSVASLLCAA